MLLKRPSSEWALLGALSGSSKTRSRAYERTSEHSIRMFVEEKTMEIKRPPSKKQTVKLFVQQKSVSVKCQ